MICYPSCSGRFISVLTLRTLAIAIRHQQRQRLAHRPHLSTTLALATAISLFSRGQECDVYNTPTTRADTLSIATQTAPMGHVSHRHCLRLWLRRLLDYRPCLADKREQHPYAIPIAWQRRTSHQRQPYPHNATTAKAHRDVYPCAHAPTDICAHSNAGKQFCPYPGSR